MVPVFLDMSSSWQFPHKHFLYCSGPSCSIILLKTLANCLLSFFSISNNNIFYLFLEICHLSDSQVIPEVFLHFRRFKP